MTCKCTGSIGISAAKICCSDPSQNLRNITGKPFEGTMFLGNDLQRGKWPSESDKGQFELNNWQDFPKSQWADSWTRCCCATAHEGPSEMTGGSCTY
ncbi:predicted protein [Plenodomus lingam JN3]|uniref:Predicted protein n=1 Tax=Leptosphaeria maculans (strain JN3 / isolate v23.1.3 / race Av1-4-5-6-7-8) TaxID=985895 RepID=E4ZSB3_LEPMJ|nr:predicted protein [Plenodomus lingam JN3]CBX94293.1 predicted protein [Plenodomus lingam JN3]